MFSNRDLSHIKNLKQLAQEKLLAEENILDAEYRLESAFAGLPGRALGGVVSMAAGAVVKGIQDHFEKKEPAEDDIPEPVPLSETLKSVGTETAMFALAKLVEKLLERRG
ncbi:MAG: hypothetical protein MUE71_03880 [Chitinophagaceae bacterium]|jgi:hypothetical protein|nr:hypothetical protein [Chitinophagaceae bacterium]